MIQDDLGLAAYRLLKKRLPVVGQAVGQYFIRLDKWSARRSAALVVISEDFRKVFEGWGIAKSQIHVIHNWAPLNEMPQRPARMIGHGPKTSVPVCGSSMPARSR